MLTIENIDNKIINDSNNKNDYIQYITNLNSLEKRKMITFLLIMIMPLSMKQLTGLTVKEFNKLKDNKQVSMLQNNNSYSSNPISVKSQFKKHLSLILIPELYNDFVKLKNDNDTLLDSPLTKKPLEKHNLRKDFNEMFTRFVLGDSDYFELTR
uniref:hypothetical protein n=1 Tax=Ulva torta TaxID=932731 RepID=UPI00220B58AC|nr:hypothetical protein OOC95_pgp027 [Ulva torta]UXW92239.1 hypothetical protein [Ulva torta]